MFLDFYKLSEQPFGVTPDSRFLYMGLEHREALASLLYTARMGRGFHALIAPPGMGKTTLLFHLLEHMRPTTRSAFLFQTQCDKREFLRYLMADIGLEISNDYVQMHCELNRFLIRNAEEGKQFILVIDEAQNLSDEVLEAVRLLSDFETSRRKLMHIILAGQPQLERKLARPNLLQLRQRISLISRMKPMDGPEVRRYIEHRLQKANYEGDRLFTNEALSLIAQHSDGIPRNVNHICFGAMSVGFACDKKTIDAEIVREVVASREMEAAPVRPEKSEAGEKVSLVGQTVERTRGAAVEARHTIAYPATSNRNAWALWSKRAATGVLAAGLFIGAALFGHRMGLQAKQRQEAAVASVAAPFTLAELPAPALPEHVLMTPPIATAHTRDVAVRKTGPTIVVAPNDTLWHISEMHFGKVNQQTLSDIQQLNSNLKNPQKLRAGQHLVLPDATQYQVSGTAISKTAESN
jgi:general secretion pathway protein A